MKRFIVYDSEENEGILGEFDTEDEAAEFIDRLPNRDKIVRGGYGLDDMEEGK